MQLTWEIVEALAYWYSSESTRWELSNEYQHDRAKLSCALVESSLSIGRVNNVAHGRTLYRVCRKVTSDLALDGDFCRVLWLPSPVTAYLKVKTQYGRKDDVKRNSNFKHQGEGNHLYGKHDDVKKELTFEIINDSECP